MIETLRVQNYKSLKDIEIPLKPLTVLVGPNAAGKSNILDCLRFLSEVATTGRTDLPFERRHGFKEVAWGGDQERLISLHVLWQPPHRDSNVFEYALEVQGPTFERDVKVKKEALSGGETGFLRGEDGLVHGDKTEFPVGPQESLLVPPGNSGRTAARRLMSSWTFYDFLAHVMRQPQPVAKQTRLTPDGGNVATLLHWIFSEQSEVFSEVEEHLKAAIPEVEKLLSPLTEDGKTYVAWREKGIPGRIPAWNMSEGSVRLVATLLALLVPEPPPLVAFENPDTHLHSHQMEYLAEILKAGSRHSQVIITTHSPYLLDHVPPESVLIVWKENGETKVKPVASIRGIRKALKELGLGELYYAGHLGAVP
ncbi:MAG: AAA family ATPase [Chloroflexi bacterium]|nr:AAA family ATPase [Chloroflexota bacterium]